MTTPGPETVSQAIVPTKALSVFARLPGDDDATVKVNVSANQLLLRVGGALISTSLVEGHFPKYQDVVPKDCDREMVVGTGLHL